MKAEEIAQQSGAFTTLAEDQSWIPNTHVEKLRNACVCRSWGSGNSGFSKLLHSLTSMHPPTHTQTQLKLISINLET